MAERHNFNLILIIAISIYKVITERERCLEKSGYDLDCERLLESESFLEDDKYDYLLNEIYADSTGKIVTFNEERFFISSFIDFP